MKYIILVTFLFSSYAAAEDILLHVKNARFVKYFDAPPENDCNAQLSEEEKKEGNVCWQFKSWYLYEATVKSVVFGKFKRKKIRFAVVLHSQFNEDYVKNMYIRLQELDLNRKKYLHVKYFATDNEAVGEISCFEEVLPEIYSNLMQSEEEDMHCYSGFELEKIHP